MFRVLIRNDDYSSIEFVAGLISHVFALSYDDSEQIAFNIHTSDSATIPIDYTRDIAESKAAQCNQCARENDFPLLSEVVEIG